MVYRLFCRAALDRIVHLFLVEAASVQVDLRGPSVLFYVSESALRLLCGLLFGLRVRIHPVNNNAAADHLCARIASREGQGVGQQSVADGVFS